MINDFIINAVEIHGKAGENVVLTTADPVECSVTAQSIFDKYIQYITDINNYCVVEAACENFKSRTVALNNTTTMRATLGKAAYTSMRFACDSNLPPSIFHREISCVSNTTSNSTLDVRATYYRKGKPTISLDKYRIRRIDGKITILKDEYI